jgi:hypothetical protein
MSEYACGEEFTATPGLGPLKLCQLCGIMHWTLPPPVTPSAEQAYDQTDRHPDAPNRSPSLKDVKAKRAAKVNAYGPLPFRIAPIWETFKDNLRDATYKTVHDVEREFTKNFPQVVKTWGRTAEEAKVALSNWWARAFGRGAAWDEGRDTALANAAMVASDMGHPEGRQAINRLIPDGSPFIPMDDPRYRKPGTAREA